MTRHITTALLAVALSSSSAISVAATAATTEPTPFGLDCAPITDGVRHCSNDGEGQRVASFDGVPIDVDVTLPPEGDGPWPTIVMIHGLGGDKGMYQRNVEMVPGEPAATPPNTTRQDNVWFASRGYAVVTPSYRAFGRSCGHGPLGLGAPGGAKLQTGPCADGFWRYQDARYEVRDVQHLLGLLADEGIAVPTRNGAMGMSSGGQIAIMVGALNDRVMCDGVDRGDLCDGHGNGDLVPWTSPDGTPMAMGAISSIWAATDLIGSVLVNGRFLDFDDDTIDQILAPRGILLQSYMDATLVVAEARGYVATTGTVDLAQDVEAAVAAWNAGEPYPPFMDDALDELARFHSPLAIKGDPAPMLLQNGWSDDFFPIRESLRLYNDLHRRFEHPDVVLLAGDYGHSRAANRDGAAVAFNDIATAFFDSRLKGEGEGPAAGSVTVYESTCPAKGDDPAVERGPFMAPSWDALATGRLLFGNEGPQAVINPGG
ncbi:MAG: CocE/NonD family hydrolase, partial [Nitriliruptorales bacterium]|nr:CocE/NonD family hydrolase [Nitriliruptorales bacterium]